MVGLPGPAGVRSLGWLFSSGLSSARKPRGACGPSGVWWERNRCSFVCLKLRLGLSGLSAWGNESGFSPFQALWGCVWSFHRKGLIGWFCGRGVPFIGWLALFALGFVVRANHRLREGNVRWAKTLFAGDLWRVFPLNSRCVSPARLPLGSGDGGPEPV